MVGADSTMRDYAQGIIDAGRPEFVGREALVAAAGEAIFAGAESMGINLDDPEVVSAALFGAAAHRFIIQGLEWPTQQPKAVMSANVLASTALAMVLAGDDEDGGIESLDSTWLICDGFRASAASGLEDETAAAREILACTVEGRFNLTTTRGALNFLVSREGAAEVLNALVAVLEAFQGGDDHADN